MAIFDMGKNAGGGDKMAFLRNNGRREDDKLYHLWQRFDFKELARMLATYTAEAKNGTLGKEAANEIIVLLERTALELRELIGEA